MKYRDIARLCLNAVFLFCSIGLFARDKIAGEVYINGQIQDCIHQTLVIDISRFDVISEEIKPYKITTTSDGSFFCHFPITNHEVYKLRQLTIVGDNGEYTALTGDYIIEPTDSIFINIRHENGAYTYTFKGRGSKKYACFNKMDLVVSRNHQQLTSSISKEKAPVEMVTKLCSQSADAILSLSDTYKGSITPGVLAVAVADNIGELYSDQLLAHIPANTRWDQHSFADSTILLARQYQLYLLKRAQYSLQSNNLKDIYYQEKKLYKGDVRDALLVMTIKSIDNAAFTIEEKDTARQLWKDAAGVIKNPVLKDYVVRRATYKEKGSSVQYFSMEDTAGSTVTLNELRGKVVLVNVWFTGCHSCVRFHKQLEKYIYPNFNNEPDLVFLNISADTSRETWRKSILSDLYTRPTDLNLISNGLGFDHPFLQYYEFQTGGESLLIGKDGKIITSGLPHQDMDLLNQILHNALLP